jgi:hypothetical protein
MTNLLSWLLEFAQDDNRWQREDWEQLKLAHEIRNFIGASVFEGGAAWPTSTFVNVVIDDDGQSKTISEVDIPLGTLNVLSDRAFNIVSGVTGLFSASGGRSLLLTLDKDVGGRGARGGGVRIRSLVLAADPANKRMAVHGTLLDLFSIRCLTLLQNADVTLITRCPECRRLFMRRVRKQQYCSKRCINRVSRRKWLEVPKNREKESGWARERYERRIQKKIGGRARVRHRGSQKQKGGKD